jgi:hypothetical protein
VPAQVGDHPSAGPAPVEQAAQPGPDLPGRAEPVQQQERRPIRRLGPGPSSIHRRTTAQLCVATRYPGSCLALQPPGLPFLDPQVPGAELAPAGRRRPLRHQQPPPPVAGAIPGVATPATRSSTTGAGCAQPRAGQVDDLGQVSALRRGGIRRRPAPDPRGAGSPVSPAPRLIEGVRDAPAGWSGSPRPRSATASACCSARLARGGSASRWHLRCHPPRSARTAW